MFEAKRFDNRPGPGLGPGGLPPLTTVPIAGERCSSRLESALDQLKRRKRTQPKNLDTPLVITLRDIGLDSFEVENINVLSFNLE